MIEDPILGKKGEINVEEKMFKLIISIVSSFVYNKNILFVVKIKYHFIRNKMILFDL